MPEVIDIPDDLLDDLVEEFSSDQVDETLDQIAAESAVECELSLSSAEMKAKELEAKGPLIWLKTLFPFAFEEEFSEEHKQFWALKWSVLLRIREQQKYLKLGLPIPAEYEIQPKEYVTLLILGRGLAKSSSIEASAVMRGALLDGGYCLYICEAQDQSEEHIGNCKGLIHNDESKLLDYYPRMAIQEGAVVGGIKTKDRADIFTTLNGWICRGKGLKSRLRGLRIGKFRPDDIKLDDIDSVNDSIAVSMSKLKQLTSSVIPTQARRHATIDFGQNLILETGVMNQIYNGQSDALAERTVIGVTKTFSYLEYESRLDPEDGKLKHYILPASVPTWSGVDISQAQKFLHDCGLFTFLAEYQNEFDQDKAELVLKNWDDSVHVITESEFAAIYGTKHIPARWYKYGGNDWSDTKSAYHANVAGFVTVSGQHEPLPGMFFVYNPMSFPAGTEADEVAMRIIESISPQPPVTGQTWDDLLSDTATRANLERYFSDQTKLIDERRKALAKVIPQYVKPILKRLNVKWFKGSHEEENNALKLYRETYGLNFSPANPGKKGGLELINHLMKVDYDKEHPIKPGVMGFSRFFLIVPDDKARLNPALKPDSLHDHDLFRYQVSHWRNVPIKMTELGIIEHGSQKMNDDYGNWLQFMFYEGAPQAVPMTEEETIVAHTPESARYDTLLAASPYENGLTPDQEMTYVINRDLAKKKARPKNKIRYFDDLGGQ